MLEKRQALSKYLFLESSAHEWKIVSRLRFSTRLVHFISDVTFNDY
jgi:hypothetical protein